MAHQCRPALRLRRARAAHRRADDADPSRQASCGVRQQSERRAREAPGAAGQERRGADARTSTPCRRTSAPLCATTAAATSITRCSGRSWARARAARRPARSATPSRHVRQLRHLQGAVRRSRRQALRQRLGLADRRRRQADDREHRQPGQPDDGRQEARSSASTCGNTPTT